MIAVLKSGVSQEQINNLIEWFKEQGLKVHLSEGDYKTILGLIGDTTKVDIDLLKGLDIIESVTRISEPYKKANRKFHPEDTIVDVSGVKIGGGNFAFIAGPCSVESRDQIIEVAKAVKASGAKLLRGGAFKPRTSPYEFQGLGYEGLEILKRVREETGLKIVTEIMSVDDVDLFEKEVDVIQVGSRNMQNFDLLKRLGKINKPILLKRGLSATIEEWLLAAEYIMNEGNPNVILCERGIRTYENETRNTLDISAVPLVKKVSHLPIIVDPSHASGKRWMIEPLSKAAIAVGADGLIIEVHNDPDNALSDGKQSITPDMLDNLIDNIKPIANIIGHNI